MPNRLAAAHSPYLLQHAHNPVDWYPWGEEALEKAKRENKLILVSIGYAACHWCHVMERECFEDEEVAALMNQYFVNIKVDREERPDIDKVYMDAVMLMTRRGGWPLNAIALPDGRPIYGGTYFPKHHWTGVLQQVAQTWIQDPDRAETYAKELLSAIETLDTIDPTQPKGQIQRGEFEALMDSWVEEMDPEWGGRNVEANKFPLPQNNLLLLRSAYYLQDQRLLFLAENTLEKMAFGGIFDQIGGGFARYSVDPHWKVPHFEKMLYDNGQLLSLYAEAYRQQPRRLYQEVITRTVDFVARELTSPEGAFYASLDADSEGEEGRFYVWSFQEVQTLLGEDYRNFCDYYNILPGGNWEGRNIPFVLETEEEFAARWQLDETAFVASMAEGRKILREARERRVRPGLDHKILTSWNGLMIKGLIDAYQALGTDHYLHMAQRAATFFVDHMTDGQRLFRSFQGEGKIAVFLDDYGHMIEAFLALYQVTFDERWLVQAEKWQGYVDVHFYEGEMGLYTYTSDEEPTFVKRKIERQDDVIPSSNAVTAHNLFILGKLTGKSFYSLRAEEILHAMKGDILVSPSWHAKWMQLALQKIFPFYEVAVVGERALEYLSAIHEAYYPHKVTMGTQDASTLPLLKDKQPSETTIYVCEGYSCRLPVNKVEDAVRQLLNG
ncbi:MAG: thioredoxin domain-containing protein [Bacteroidota bacterium]